MYTGQIKKVITTIGLCSSMCAMSVLAANNGLPDNRVHQFAGYLGIPSHSAAVGAGCSSDVIYFSCGGYLVDAESIGLPKALDRRIFLTAGHCTDAHDSDKPFIVHFQDGDARVVGNSSCPRVIDFKTSGFNYYTGTRSWSLFTVKSSGVGVGSGKLDYAIILLDTPVSQADVNKLAKVSFTNQANALTVSSIPTLGMAGFGVAGFGDPDQQNSLGKPLVINGPREKMYVEMPTRAVQKWNISSEMNAAQADQTACNGDSGSALFSPTTDQNGFYNVYGHVANGDFNCRATNTSTRVDTQEFRNFVNSVSVEIISAAGL